MSIYTALKFPIPVMAYCALHQVRKGKDSEDYKKTMKDFHRLLQGQTESINKHWEEYCNDAQERTVQTARGLLAPFLTTPLKSDNDEIRRILKDQILEYTRLVTPRHRYGVASAREARILMGYDAAGLTRKLLASGKAHLKELQFQTEKNSEEIFESAFFIEGGVNFDVIEHLVRDRIGIYTPVHGKHITEFDAYAYTAYNLIYSSDSNPGEADHEASMYFSKGPTHYEPFRNALSELLDSLGSIQGVLSISGWQRKLGLGAGKEFLLRFMLKGTEKVRSIVDAVEAYKEKPFVRDALLGGHLLLKEVVV